MDPIDRNLLDAWEAVRQRMERERAFAQARLEAARRFRVSAPMRAWCLALRASDTRITDWDAIIVPRRGWMNREAHDVELDAAKIKALTRPVRLDWPGVRQRDAARLLGVTETVVWRWVKRGRLSVRYEHPGAYGYAGPRTPMVWSAGLIDPGMMEGRPPEDVWGTLWQHLWKRVPEGFTLGVERVPRVVSYPGRGEQFRGWDWLCPGRVNVYGEHRPCGERCRWLYAVTPAWSMIDALGQAETASPIGGHDDPTQWRPRFGFACYRCWKWQSMNVNDRVQAWNLFVRHISAGLLFGSEVRKPTGVCEYPRKKRGKGTGGRAREGMRARASAH